MLREQTINTAANIIWATISNGYIVTKSDQSDPKAKSRVNKLGNTVYERYWASIFGQITSIVVEDNKFGETDIRVGLEDDDNQSVLTFKLDSSYGRSFLSQIFNADLTKKIEFKPWTKVKEDGTKVTRLYLSYGVRNSNVEWKLPQGTPEVNFIEVKGKKVVDTRSQIEHITFLTDKLNEFIQVKGLTYLPAQVDTLGENVDTTPLSEAEIKSLNQLKKATSPKTKVESAPINEVSQEDFFNDFN
jgi:hypothetical protein